MFLIRMFIAFVLLLLRDVCISGRRCAMHICKSLHVMGRQLHSQALLPLGAYWFHSQQDTAITECPKGVSETRTSAMEV